MPESTAPQIERRVFPRRSVCQPVTVIAGTETPLKLTGISRDVSGNGIYISIDNEQRSFGHGIPAGMFRRRYSWLGLGLRQGSSVCVIFRLQKSREPGQYRIRGQGTIARVEDLPNGGFGIGVCFEKQEVLTET